MVIQLRLPCSCSKRYYSQKCRPSTVRSPFNMIGAEQSWKGSEFLNYWNLNQTILLEGRSTVKMLELFLGTVRHRNPSCKVTEGSDRIQTLDNEQTKAELKALCKHALRFSFVFNELALQLRYSIMSLLSSNKVSLFNETLISLMKSLLD